MKAQDFRIGNLVNYKIVDELDPRKEWFEVSEIDYDDLRILGIKDEMNKDYQPIPLTEEWLLKFGFKLHYGTYTIKTNRGTITIEEDLAEISNEFSNTGFNAPCKYVHQLQNIYHALTGEELTLKELK